ncbi:hypothetical protein [Streptomyces sp. NPDC056169]|uniref:hypothetical protein n=1 Tax=Streptomyces sp. NPDC056169 TaxID=3345734 RepID=UPI0035E2644B
MTQPTPRTTWQDGDPYLEAIAAAVWEHCEKQHGSGIVIDDPRNIAEAVAATSRAAAFDEAADAIDATYTGFGIDRYVRHGADLLRRMAEEARS